MRTTTAKTNHPLPTARLPCLRSILNDKALAAMPSRMYDVVGPDVDVSVEEADA
jgi:hypothetical protein